MFDYVSFLSTLQKNLDASEIKCLEYKNCFWRYVVVCYVWIVFALILALIFFLQRSICYLLPLQIIKVNLPTVRGQQWSEWVTDMVIELMTHRTPPESITFNILTVCRLFSPNNNIVGSLPGVDFSINVEAFWPLRPKNFEDIGLPRR